MSQFVRTIKVSGVKCGFGQKHSSKHILCVIRGRNNVFFGKITKKCVDLTTGSLVCTVSFLFIKNA